MRIRLGDDHDALGAVHVDRECGGAARPEGRVAVFDGELDVLRVVIPAVDDDQVLAAARDEQLIAPHEAEIARAQERSFARVRQGRTERRLGLGGLLPVAVRHAGTGDPDLADLAVAQRHAALWLDDHDALSTDHAAAADQIARRLEGAGHRRRLATLETGGVKWRDRRRCALGIARHEQRRLREAVDRREGTRLEAARPECARELADRPGSHRFGAVERHAPRP